MSKTIKLNYEGRTYVLEFNRTIIRNAERAGFNINEIGDKPVTMIPLLVYSAFAMHNDKLKSHKIDEIYESVGDKDAFLGALIDMYRDAVAPLIEKGDEDKAKNVSWEASWDVTEESND